MKIINLKQFIILFLIFFLFFGDLFYLKKRMKQILKYLNNFITKKFKKKRIWTFVIWFWKPRFYHWTIFLKNNEQIFNRN